MVGTADLAAGGMYRSLDVGVKNVADRPTVYEFRQSSKVVGVYMRSDRHWGKTGKAR